jgi:hypothetical protein
MEMTSNPGVGFSRFLRFLPELRRCRSQTPGSRLGQVICHELTECDWSFFSSKAQLTPAPTATPVRRRLVDMASRSMVRSHSIEPVSGVAEQKFRRFENTHQKDQRKPLTLRRFHKNRRKSYPHGRFGKKPAPKPSDFYRHR